MVHLAKEDKSLYPRLLESGDRAIVSLTQRFIDEMGDLSATFGARTNRWGSPANIFERRDDSAAETAQVLGALGQRFDRENNELYNLADTLPD